jgi:hypothetical protein
VAPDRDLSIRPLGPGEVIDRSVALTRRHFRALFAAMLVIEAPALALVRMEQARATQLAAAAGDPGRAAELLSSATPFFVGVLASLLFVQLAATAAAAAIVAPSLDPRPPAGPSRVRRAAAVATAALVQVAALLLAPALGAAPGILLAMRAETFATHLVGIAAAVLGGIALLLVVLLRLVLVAPIAAVEGHGGVAAVLRSVRLMAPARGGRFADRPGVRASLVLLATFLLAFAVNALAGLPRALAAQAVGAEGALGLLGATLPLPWEVGISVLEAAATAALQPFSLVAIAVLYFERRVRTEALDAEIWAARLEAGR